jgi:hypothetical protein
MLGGFAEQTEEVGKIRSLEAEKLGSLATTQQQSF